MNFNGAIPIICFNEFIECIIGPIFWIPRSVLLRLINNF